MTLLHRLASVVRWMLRRDRAERDLHDELEAFLDMASADGQRSGATPADARRRAVLHLGGVEQAKERVRSGRHGASLDALARDLRYAVRTCARNPGFSAIVIATLALGIGANTTVFGVIDAVLVRPLAYGDRLVHVAQATGVSGETTVAPVRLEDWNRMSSTFEGLAGYTVEDVADNTFVPAEPVRRATVSPRFLAVWNAAPFIGRAFAEADHRRGSSDVVILSERYWRSRLGADPRVVGRTVRIVDRRYAVVGVLPASFPFPDRDVDWWMPGPVDESWTTSRQNIGYASVGRLKPDVTLAQARADLANVQAELGRLHPATDAKITVRVVPYKERVTGSVRRSLWLLWGAVSVLLLIACTNIAALLLARGTKRHQEIAIRHALGASRPAVARQLLAEVAVLASVSAIAGVAVAAAASAALRNLAPTLPRVEELGLDARALAFAAGSTIAVALLCGVLPALRGVRSVAVPIGTPRSQVSGAHSVQWLMAGVQVALSVMLLTGAALLLRSFANLSQVERGFDAARVLTFRVSGSYAEARNYAALHARINRTLDALRDVPGVEAAATALTLPGTGIRDQVEYELVEGRAPSGSSLVAEWRIVSPGYFELLRMPVVEGELCRMPADPNGPAGWMVNRRLAERYGTHGSLVGRSLARPAGPEGLRTSAAGVRILGIVGDAREVGLDLDPGPTVYGCFTSPTPFPWFLVRTTGESRGVVAAVRRKIAEIEPLRAVYDTAPLDERIDRTNVQYRVRAVVLALFAASALALACVGVYGTLSYIVSLRRREVGLRLALGARRATVVRQFLGQGLRVAAVACLAGLALSAALGRVLAGMLFGVSPFDPSTLSGVIGIVAAVVAIAALVPAVRAALLEPTEALRED